MFTLSWQPPYDWPRMLGFLAARAVEGVETVEELELCPKSVRRGASWSGERCPGSARQRATRDVELRVTACSL